ncbi:hypothetical protein ARMSODRAFT_982899 [Armillaria solidipes]|uniref:Uncharacterized protein n=1 Tax=Armillaria solidipes TaxID=1076256 RepID=A0A2H3AL76_9AGAR|nr:hypothetical protein ARMSODRAFT_982899 [Armillaria solidipes]
MTVPSSPAPSKTEGRRWRHHKRVGIFEGVRAGTLGTLSATMMASRWEIGDIIFSSTLENGGGETMALIGVVVERGWGGFRRDRVRIDGRGVGDDSAVVGENALSQTGVTRRWRDSGWPLSEGEGLFLGGWGRDDWRGIGNDDGVQGGNGIVQHVGKETMVPVGVVFKRGFMGEVSATAAMLLGEMESVVVPVTLEKEGVEKIMLLWAGLGGASAMMGLRRETECVVVSGALKNGGGETTAPIEAKNEWEDGRETKNRVLNGLARLKDGEKSNFMPQMMVFTCSHHFTTRNDATEKLAAETSGRMSGQRSEAFFSDYHDEIQTFSLNNDPRPLHTRYELYGNYDATLTEIIWKYGLLAPSSLHPPVLEGSGYDGSVLFLPAIPVSTLTPPPKYPDPPLPKNQLTHTRRMASDGLVFHAPRFRGCWRRWCQPFSHNTPPSSPTTRSSDQNSPPTEKNPFMLNGYSGWPRLPYTAVFEGAGDDGTNVFHPRRRYHRRRPDQRPGPHPPQKNPHPRSTATQNVAIVSSPPFSRVPETMVPTVSPRRRSCHRSPTQRSLSRIPLPTVNDHIDWRHRLYTPVFPHDVADAPTNDPGPIPPKKPSSSLNGHTEWGHRLVTPVFEGAGDDGAHRFPPRWCSHRRRPAQPSRPDPYQKNPPSLVDDLVQCRRLYTPIFEGAGDDGAVNLSLQRRH